MQVICRYTNGWFLAYVKQDIDVPFTAGAGFADMQCKRTAMVPRLFRPDGTMCGE